MSAATRHAARWVASWLAAVALAAGVIGLGVSRAGAATIDPPLPPVEPTPPPVVVITPRPVHQRCWVLHWHGRPPVRVCLVLPPRGPR